MSNARSPQTTGLPADLPDDPVRLALYVFGLRDRPVRDTRISRAEAGKLASAISTFRYDVNAQSRGDADFGEIAWRLDDLESQTADIVEHLEARGKGRRDWLNLLISTSFDIGLGEFLPRLTALKLAVKAIHSVDDLIFTAS